MKTIRSQSFAAFLGAAFTTLSMVQTQAAVVFLGDAASQGASVTDQQTPDASNAGAFTYAFTNSGYTNSTGSAVSVSINSINFWSDNGTGNLTPFFATYSGSNIGLASNYSVLTIGTPISAATVGLHNAGYTASLGSGSFTLGAGQTLVAGFFQDSSIVPFLTAVGDSEYIFNNSAGGPASAGTGYTLPASVPNPLTSNGSYSTLNRTYAYDAQITVVAVPEPAGAALLLLSSLGLVRRRRI